MAPFFETQCTQPQPTQAPPRCTKCNSPPFNCQCTSVDYGNIILVGAPKSVTNKLQRVLNAAAWIVTDTRNMIKDCHIYCILSCTGWTSRSGSCCSDGPPMSPGQGAAVFVELLCASLWSCQSSATAICLSSSASTDPTISSQNIRPSGFCCGWPDVLELTGRWTANLL